MANRTRAVILWVQTAATATHRVMVRLMRGVAQNGGPLLGLCGIIIIWATVLHFLSAERTQALQDARRQTSNLARAFEEDIVRSIKSVDQTLLYVRDSYEKDPNGFDIAAWQLYTRNFADLTFQIAIIDRRGVMAGSTLAEPGTSIDLSDREYFKTQRDDPSDQLFISKPVFGRASHKWSIQLTRKLVGKDGAFNGVVVVSLDPDYLSNFYDSVDLGKYGEVTLLGVDGAVRAHAGAPAAADGRATAMDPVRPNTPMLAAPEQDGSKNAGAVGQIDGIRRIYAYRGVSGYPLIVSVGIGEADVLAVYEANLRSYGLLATVLSTLLLAVTALVVLRQQRLNRAREQLKASESDYAHKSQLLETTLEHMSQGIMMVDADRRVQVCNREAMEKLSLPQTMMLTQPTIDQLVRWTTSQGHFRGAGPSIIAGLERLVSRDGVIGESLTYECVRADGMVLEVQGTALPGGGVVCTYTDITLHTENELVLRAARDDADQAARAKSDFLATMSHEIRSPMSGLVGVLDLLRETDLDREQQRMALMASNSAMTLLDVLNDILDFSKIEADAMTIVLASTHVVELVSELVEPHRLAAARRDVALQLTFSDDIPNAVDLDALRVRQILNNLLSNAVKFTPSGHIALTVDVTADGDGPLLRFDVSDTGIGMDDAVLGRLFEPFMQADGSTTRNFGGTGLGLSICLRLAHLLQGTLTVSSAPGVGTAFTLLLPLVCVAASADSAPPSAAIAFPVPTKKTRVLVVDDDPTNRWLSQRRLETLGYSVDIAENGEVALEMLHSQSYDLLLTDCHMPRMDGAALTRAVRDSAQQTLRDLPIIGLTADVTSGQRARCQAAGMSEIVHKPLTRDELGRLLAVHLPDTGFEPDWLPAETPGAPADKARFDPRIYHELFSSGDIAGPAWLTQYLDIAGRLHDELSELAAVTDATALDRTRLASVAHNLVGCSLSAGAKPLGDMARGLETAGKSAEPALLQARIDEMGDELLKLGQEILAFIAIQATQYPDRPF